MLNRILSTPCAPLPTGRGKFEWCSDNANGTTLSVSKSAGKIMDLSELSIGVVRMLGVVALVVLSYSWVIRQFPTGIAKGAAVGVLFGIGGIASMNDPILFAPGVFYDARTALLVLCYTYGGPIGTIIATAMMVACRLWIGGLGAVTGSISIVLSGLIGLVCALIPIRRFKVGPLRSAFLGLAASGSFVTLALLPHEIASLIIGAPLLALTIGNVVSVMIISSFLEREKRRQRLMRALEHEASVDPLTKLQNRRTFERAALRAMNDNRMNARKCALILIDIDHFKAINDRWGHEMGDLVLSGVAAMIRDNVRKSDVVVRYGGEEIALLMPNTALDVAADLAERIRNLIAETDHRLGSDSVRVTVSAGVAVLGVRVHDMHAVMKAADNALYRAKSSGRNRVEIA